MFWYADQEAIVVEWTSDSHGRPCELVCMRYRGLFANDIDCVPPYKLFCVDGRDCSMHLQLL